MKKINAKFFLPRALPEFEILKKYAITHSLTHKLNLVKRYENREERAEDYKILLAKIKKEKEGESFPENLGKNIEEDCFKQLIQIMGDSSDLSQ